MLSLSYEKKIANKVAKSQYGVNLDLAKYRIQIRHKLPFKYRILER